MHVRSFDPIAKPDATLLILGSMPGRASLEAGQYYAHGRNAFWPILGDVFGFDPRLLYEKRRAELVRNRIAVWDVLQACFRTSSLDADIDESSIVPNDFAPFFSNHPRINTVLFNGTKPHDVFEKHVAPKLTSPAVSTPRFRMPSTSPANASMTFEQKLARWKERLT